MEHFFFFFFSEPETRGSLCRRRRRVSSGSFVASTVRASFSRACRLVLRARTAVGASARAMFTSAVAVESEASLQHVPTL